MKNVVIILAAGNGKRCNTDKPKQFIKIAGKPILIHTLEKFEKHKDIHEIKKRQESWWYWIKHVGLIVVGFGSFVGAVIEVVKILDTP